MIERLKTWLMGEIGVQIDPRDELQLAVAALLLEAATVDGHLDERERVAVRSLLQRRFTLSPEQARDLAATAEQRAAQTTQLFGFVRIINERFSAERRAELVEMLWEIAYADGVLDPLEDAMLRRVAGLIHVPDHERGAARLRVLKRLGRSGES